MHNWVDFILDVFPVILLVLLGFLLFTMWKTSKLWKMAEKHIPAAGVALGRGHF